jgi:hypothetical protein
MVNQESIPLGIPHDSVTNDHALATISIQWSF